MIDEDFNENTNMSKKKKILKSSFGSCSDLEQKALTVTVYLSPSQYKSNHMKSSSKDTFFARSRDTHGTTYLVYFTINVKRLALEGVQFYKFSFYAVASVIAGHSVKKKEAL